MPYIIAMNGPSCAGKSYISRLLKNICPERISILSYDAYCCDNGDLTPEQIKQINYDVPAAYDAPLLTKHIKLLRENKSIEIPIYDFCHHRRIEKTIHFEPNDVIIVEGIMVFQVPFLMNSGGYDLKIAIDANENTRYERRFKRDQIERGRTPESIEFQWKTSVQPSCEVYIDTVKELADIVIFNNKNNHQINGLDAVEEKIKEILGL